MMTTTLIREALVAARETLEKVSRLFTEEHQLVLGGKRWGETAIAKIDAALAALDAETPATPADVGEEPVAWQHRYKHKDSEKWGRWREYDPALAGYSDWLHETRALYSATALERVTSETTTLRARLETVEAETRERIAAALDEEADLTPCAEDAMVTRSNARLVRANFSYEDAERLEAEEDAAAIRNLEPRHD